MNEPRNQSRSDRIILFVTLTLAAVYFYATEQLPDIEIGDPLGPKAFPRLLGVGLLIAAGLLYLEMLRGRTTEPDDEPAPAGERPSWGVLAAVVTCTLVYFSLFEMLGYIVATTAYLLALTFYFNRGKWLANLFSCVFFSFLTYLMFSYLGVTLPQGVLSWG